MSMADLTDGLTIGVLGGTGAQGRGLAVRWALSGLQVVIGSRDAGHAADAAAEIAQLARVDPSHVRGADNAA
ncbi:MAG: 8-hydroxy-5-deazaflavin:NADPH oxidoreductase, partial [Nocardioidaceae bacterium]|nr:8-hydroxy-5-deazaflavin:NADPH oxidoreductase [Nocardioidaceae bacterium]